MIFISLFSALTLSLKPIYLVAGFGQSHIYGTVTEPSLYPECPENVERMKIRTPNANTEFIDQYPNCVTKLLRVQLNTTTGKVEQLPGMITDSSPIGSSSYLSEAFSNIINKAKEKGYVDEQNLFSVGYNYLLHPVTSYDVYNKLKSKIEEVYSKTKEKAVIISFSQGTSFTSIFVSNYSDPVWVKKYIDSIVFLAPAFAGWSDFSQLFDQTLSPFPNNDEMKNSIMRMPGLHMMLPNYEVFGDKTIIYNMNQDFDQHNASHSFEFLKKFNKVDSDAESIFKVEVEKYLKVAVPEPPVPSLIVYNDNVLKKTRYSVYQHQNQRVVSMYNATSDGTVTSDGAEYACGHWSSVKCKNLHDSTSHDGIVASDAVAQYAFDFIDSNKELKEEPKIGLFLASGFQGSPLYATVTDASKATMCPSNLKHSLFYTTFASSSKLIDDTQNHWLSDECLAILTRVELDSSEKFVTYAPGIHLESSSFGEYDHLLSYTKIIERAYQEGYTHYKDLFGVGYNYMLHPLMSNEVYEELKTNIEKYYEKTGKKSVVTGHSQGTSFVQIFITDYVTKEWAQKYIAGVIFYAPAFAGWGTYDRLVSSNYGGGFPDSNPEMKKSTMRMPGLHIMMPNEGVYGNKTVINNYPTQGAQANASLAADCLMHIGRMDETAYKIFKLTNKYRVPPLPEPPVPSLVIYNSGKSNNNGYNFDQSKDTISGSRLQGTGDGTVADDGPVYACNNWKNVQCYDYKRTDIDHSNIQTQKVTLDLTFDFVNNVNKYNPTQNERVEYYKGVTGDFSNNTYVDERKVANTEFTATVNSGEKSSYPLSNAFNGHNNQFWISEKPNSDSLHNSIYINFNKNITLEALLFDSAYGTKGTTRTYYGFPTQLKVYASFGDNPYQLNTVFIGTPTYPCARFQFVFPEPVTCDKLILEIVDLLPDTWQSDGNRNAVISLTFIKHYPKLQKFIPYEGKYANNDYINQYKVLPEMISSSSCNGGEKSGYSFSQAFDGVTNKFYVSNTDNEPNFHNTITVSFAKKMKLDGFIYYGAYTTVQTTKVRTFCGFPIQLKVYASLGDQPYELIATYIGSTKDTDTNFQFIFPSPVFCDKIQIEFVEVTPDTWQSNGALRPVVSINFIQALPYEELTFRPYEGKYANDDFVNQHRFNPSTFKYSSNGGESSTYPLANAFDLATNNYHISGTENSETFHNKYYINFTNVVSVEGFIYYSAYTTDKVTKVRQFCGFPSELKVYASIGNQPYEPIALFTGTTKDTDTNFQFIFSTPVRCDKLMLEFIEVTPEVWQSGGVKKPIVNVNIIQYFTHEELTFIPYEGNYTNVNYVDLRRQDSSKITVTSNGGEKSDYPITNIFNGVTNKFYISNTPNSDDFHNSIFVNFNKKVTLEGFIDYAAYVTDKTTKVRAFCGFPLKMNVYTSIDDEPYELIAVFTGATKNDDTNFQFIFSKPIVCDKIQLEIVEVTPDNWQSGGVLNPVLSINFIYYYDHNFNLIKYIPYTGNYANQDYVNQNRIDPSTFKYSSNGGENSNHPLDNAFDLATNNYHISGTANSETFHNKYYINFTNVVSVEGFIYYSAYTTDGTTKVRQFCGFPIESKIYYSVNNGPYIPSTIFIGQTANGNTNFQFVFSSPIVCDKLLIELVDVSPDVWQSGGVKNPIMNNIFIQKEVPVQTQAPFASSTPEPTPKASPTSLPLEFICIENKHCEVDGEEFKPARLDISNSHYIDIENLNDNGGAIRVGNSELELNKVEFTRCSTSIGGGGGIYIKNDIKMNNKVTLHNLNFNNCEALYGGAVCLFSNVDEFVEITGCKFIGNKATSSESSTGSILSGGNAVFACAQSLIIKRNTFRNNEGDGTLKLLNYFDASNQLKTMQSSIHMNNDNKYVSVSDCRFEMNKKSIYSIFYIGGIDGVEPVLSHCNFTGVLHDGASFIDGKLLSKDSIKLHVKSCKFAYDSKKAIKMNNDYLNIGIKEQEFNFNETVNNDIANWKLIVTLVLPVAAVLMATVIILSIVILKKRSKLNHDEADMPAEIREQSLI